jgi:hypothetical protein
MQRDDGLSRLTVDIPAALHRRLKVEAAQNDMEIRELVTLVLMRAFPTSSSGFRQLAPEEMARLERAFPKSKKGGD